MDHEKKNRLRIRLKAAIAEVITQLFEWRELEGLLRRGYMPLANRITEAIIEELLTPATFRLLTDFYRLGTITLSGSATSRLTEIVFEKVSVSIDQDIIRGDYQGNKRIFSREIAIFIITKLENNENISMTLAGITGRQRKLTRS
jgi:hypothetical protein